MPSWLLQHNPVLIKKKFNNQSICNAIINGKYLSNDRDYSDGKYLRANCNLGVTYTIKIGDIPGYSNPVWYNPKGIDNIL